MPSPAIREWYSATELADLHLPGLPRGRREINKFAVKHNWRGRYGSLGQPLSRTRAGRGGGYEYHIELLPHVAQVTLALRNLPTKEFFAKLSVAFKSLTVHAESDD